MPGVLYYNGDILTMEPQLYAPAILVESGRIRAVGSKQQLEAAFGPGVEAFDLQGRTLMPAFIDPHSHITAYASTLALADLSQAKSFAEMKEILLGFMNRRDLPKARGSLDLATITTGSLSIGTPIKRCLILLAQRSL